MVWYINTSILLQIKARYPQLLLIVSTHSVSLVIPHTESSSVKSLEFRGSTIKLGSEGDFHNLQTRNANGPIVAI